MKKCAKAVPNRWALSTSFLDEAISYHGDSTRTWCLHKNRVRKKDNKTLQHLLIIRAEIYFLVKALCLLKEQLADISVSWCCGLLLRETRLSWSVSGRFADFVVNLWEGLLTAELLSEFVVEPSVKHVPKLFSTHVNVSIQHLESVWNPETVSLTAHRQARHMSRKHPLWI